MKLRAFNGPTALVLFSVALMSLGCGRQQEGERCDTANDDIDCDVGLRCTERPGENSGAICCANPSGVGACSPLLESAPTTEEPSAANTSDESPPADPPPSEASGDAGAVDAAAADGG